MQVEAAAKKFGQPIEPQTSDRMLEEYSNAGVAKLVLFAWDAETTTHRPKVSNEFVSKIVEEYPDRIVGFGSVDPHKRTALTDLDYALRELKLSGLKLHPQVQAFEPNNSLYYPLYAKCTEFNVPITFHTGSTYWGAGLKGEGT